MAPLPCRAAALIVALCASTATAWLPSPALTRPTRPRAPPRAPPVAAAGALVVADPIGVSSLGVADTSVLLEQGFGAWLGSLSGQDKLALIVCSFLFFYVIPSNFANAVEQITNPKEAERKKQALVKSLEDKYNFSFTKGEPAPAIPKPGAVAAPPPPAPAPAPATAPAPAVSATSDEDEDECEIDMDTMMPLDPEKCT